MLDLLAYGRLTMALGIYRTRTVKVRGKKKKKKERVADFSYQNESLAQMIVDAWTDSTFRNDLLSNPATAKAELAKRGIYLSDPVVITEDQYYSGYTMPDPEGVVFVLPDPPRTDTPSQGDTLLETAKLLMACTPNGI
jgi:hypothetical protein